MNVLQLVPELNTGGVEGTTLEVAQALIAEGHSAHVISAGGRMEDELLSMGGILHKADICLLYTSPSPRDRQKSRMPSSA